MSAYLEKSGYGSQAAAPVVKCTFLALADPSRLDPVELSDPLDLDAVAAAPPQQMRDASCWNSRNGNGVLVNTRSVD
jgi:penicillin-binding protein 2